MSLKEKTKEPGEPTKLNDWKDICQLLAALGILTQFPEEKTK